MGLEKINMDGGKGEKVIVEWYYDAATEYTNSFSNDPSTVTVGLPSVPTKEINWYTSNGGGWYGSWIEVYDVDGNLLYDKNYWNDWRNTPQNPSETISFGSTVRLGEVKMKYLTTWRYPSNHTATAVIRPKIHRLVPVSFPGV